MPSITPSSSPSVPSSQITGRNRGVATPAGNGVLTAFTIAHGLGSVPTYFNAVAGNLLSAGPFFITADATNLTVTFVAAPGVGALSLRWVAEL